MVQKWCDRVILWTLLVLVFFLPLVYDPRLFDVVSLPKVTLLRFCVLIMAAAWLVKTGTGHKAQGTGHKAQGTGHKAQGTRHKAQGTRHRTLPYILHLTPYTLACPVLGFLGICIIGTIFSIDPKLSFFGVYKFYFWGLGSILCYVMLYFIVVSSLRPEDIDKILLVLLCSGALVSILGITQHFGFGITHWGKTPRGRVISTLGNPNFLGAYLVMVIPVGISYALGVMREALSVRRKFRLTPYSLRLTFYGLGLVACALCLVCLLFTYSRGAWVGFGGSLVLLGVSFRKELLKHWKPVVMGAIIVLALFIWKGGSFIQRGISIADLQEPDIASRFSAWESTLQMVKEHPFLGTGLDTYVLKFRQYMSVDYEHLAGKLAMAGFAHNHFLQVASDLGLVGFGIYLWLLFVFFATCFRLLPITDYRLPITGIMTGVFALVIQDQFSFSPLTTSTYFWLFLGLTAVMGKQVQSPKSKVQSRKLRSHLVTMSPSHQSQTVKREALGVRRYLLLTPRALRLTVLTVVVFFLGRVISRPYRADLHFNKAMAYKAAEHYENAIEEYKRALLLNFYPGIYRMNLAKTYIQQAEGSRQRAGGRGEEAASSRQRGDKKKFLRKAVEEFKREIAARPLSALGYNGLGVAYLELGKLGDDKFYDFSLEALSKAVELDPNFADAWTNLGVVYEKKKLYNEAISAYKKALEIDPRRTLSLFNLGCIYGNRGRYKEARECWERVLEIDPQYEKAGEYLNLLKTR